MRFLIVDIQNVHGSVSDICKEISSLEISKVVYNSRISLWVKATSHKAEMMLQKEKAEFKDVEDTLNSLSDSQRSRIAALYDEMDWMKVVDSLNGALPAGGQYTNLSLSSFQIGGSDASKTDDHQHCGQQERHTPAPCQHRIVIVERFQQEMQRS